jgi:hypothetical protein
MKYLKTFNESGLSNNLISELSNSIKTSLDHIYPHIEDKDGNIVDVSGEIRSGNLIKQFGDKPLFYHKDAAVLDPGALMGYYSAVGTVDDPWTSRLKGKRVLVISTHAESIKAQWKNIDLHGILHH